MIPAAFLKECFDPVEGNGYTLCRTTIHSSDYSASMYTCDDVAGDTELKHFSIAPDRKTRLPLIKRAQAVTKGKLRLFASPWSPPAWMKTNNDMLHGGKLKPEYRQAWADYFVKYIKAYAAEGLPIWGLTDKHLIFTEGSTRGTWQSATRLAKQVIMDLNNWTSACTIWNMLLDEQGGPRHAGGLMGGTGINANLKTGELSFNPPHYASLVTSRGSSVRARGGSPPPPTATTFVATAFLNTDGKIAVVLHNTSDHEQLAQLWVAGKALKFSCPAGGVVTLTM